MNDRELPDEFEDWDAAYVLGALSADDRRAYEQHLATCAICRDAVTDLAGMPGILAALQPADAVALDQPDGASLLVRDHVPGRVRLLAAKETARRRSRRRLVIGASAFASAGLLAVGLVTGVAVVHPAAAALPAAVAMAPVGAPVMTASLRVEPKGWGTRLDWSCAYTSAVANGTYLGDYELVVTDTSGRTTVVATWEATSPKSGDLSASTDIAAPQIRSVSIRQEGSTTPLVRATL